MKKHILILLCVSLSLLMVACSGNTQNNNTSATNSIPASIGDEQESNAPITDGEASNILIAYFSRTGTTEEAAITIQELTGGDIFRINAAVPYPDDYNEVLEVAEQEYYDDARPDLLENVANIAGYDVVFIGYPIWYDTTPMIIGTFLETNDFSGKTIIPFCTSGSNSIQNSVTRIRTLCPDADVLDGLRVSKDADIEPWLKEISILN